LSISCGGLYICVPLGDIFWNVFLFLGICFVDMLSKESFGTKDWLRGFLVGAGKWKSYDNQGEKGCELLRGRD
jgi:hypothetical protein